MESYFTSSHVHACLADRHLVFLDLKRDKYLCLDETTSRALDWLVDIESASGLRAEAARRILPPSVEAIVADLHKQGILTQGIRTKERADDHLGFHPIPDRIMSPVAPRPIANRRPPTSRQLWHFARATISAKWKLRTLPIERTVQEVTRRRDRRGKPQLDTHSTSEVVSAFHAMRPLFPHKQVCLFDSLALLDFLAPFDAFPTWVFGVKMNPFMAHCWVQDGPIVLNENIDYVKQFTIIMTA